MKCKNYFPRKSHLLFFGRHHFLIPALKENKFQKKAQAETNELETTKKKQQQKSSQYITQREKKKINCENCSMLGKEKVS